MFIKILIGLAVIVAIFCAVVATRPNEFRVTRSATMQAAPATIFPHVNDLHKWQAWSPWAKLDPNSKETFSGPESGVGSSLAWAGNKDVGEGNMTIIGNKPNEQVLIDLKFIKPFEGSNLVEFTFAPKGNETVVTWSMAGKSNFIFKAMGLFMDCDKMCGDQFEQGLASLKKIVETK